MWGGGSMPDPICTCTGPARDAHDKSCPVRRAYPRLDLGDVPRPTTSIRPAVGGAEGAAGPRTYIGRDTTVKMSIDGRSKAGPAAAHAADRLTAFVSAYVGPDRTENDPRYFAAVLRELEGGRREGAMPYSTRALGRVDRLVYDDPPGSDGDGKAWWGKAIAEDVGMVKSTVGRLLKREAEEPAVNASPPESDPAPRPQPSPIPKPPTMTIAPPPKPAGEAPPQAPRSVHDIAAAIASATARMSTGEAKVREGERLIAEARAALVTLHAELGAALAGPG